MKILNPVFRSTAPQTPKSAVLMSTGSPWQSDPVVKSGECVPV